MTLNKKNKIAIKVLNDIILSLVSTWLAISIRFNEIYIPQSLYWHKNIIYIFLLSIIIFLITFTVRKIYFSVIRFSGLDTLRQIIIAIIVYGFVLSIFILTLKLDGVPRSIAFVQPIIFMLLVLLSRITAAQIILFYLQSKNIRNIIIYGAGKSGIEISKAASINNSNKLIAFVDNDKNKIGTDIDSIPIISPLQLKDTIKNNNVIDLLVALPNLDLLKRRKLINELNNFNIRVKILPSTSSVMSENININDFKNIELNEILDRYVSIDLKLLKNEIKNQVILITGAGGSIGSELTKQIIVNEPNKLILLDHSEINLYKILSEVTEIKKNNEIKTTLVPILGSIQNNETIKKLYLNHEPQLIYHAAAYKHVPLIEENIFEAINNNIIGTLNLIKAFDSIVGKKFILVSTDKAVRPTNIMGATKRITELIVQGYASLKKSNKIYSIVRFGNVLNSSGSVVPLFQSQINSGGPVTVTHPDVTRYFMTIPEATSLILQCGILAKNGELFILNMGDPIKIVDIAKKMIRLFGYYEKSVHEDGIEIIFIGLRPGEKLFEELFISSDFSYTDNKDIMIGNENYMKLDDLLKFIDLLVRMKNDDDVSSIKNLISNNNYISYKED